MTSSLRPLLVPGARLYRLGATMALIGSNPGTPVRLRPGTFELLTLLNGARDLNLLQQLLQRDVPEFEGNVHEVLAPLIHVGAVLPRRPARFRLAEPAISADGPADEFAGLLKSAFSTLRAPESPASSETPWHIVVSTGEPSRAALDPFLSAGLTHVPVVLDENTVHLGPLTVPASSPCLNCYDEHRYRTEPRWPALAAQFGSRRVECGVTRATQYLAIAELLRIFEADGGNSLIGQRISVSPSQETRTVRFGFGTRCHCDLLAA